MVALPTPFEAYRLDLSRAGSEDDFGAADSMWLLVAHCLSRFANQPETARLDLAERCAQALRQFAETERDAVDVDGVKPLDETALGDLSRLIEGLSRYRERVGQELLAKTVLEISMRMSALGALTLAYTMVGSAREAIEQISDRTRGLLLGEQARITRLLGQLDDAEAMYAMVRGIAERSGDRELEARSALGTGVVAQRRGNYPRARECFERGLSCAAAEGNRDLEAIAHQGLMMTSLISADCDRVLRHGWEALIRSAGNTVRETEVLCNMAIASLEAGYPRAALQANLRCLANSREHRIVVPVLGNAALAAAHCGEVSMVEVLGARLERAISESALPFENASAAFDLANALETIGQVHRAERLRGTARAIAAERGFFELLHRMDSDELTRRAVQPVQRRELDETTQSVVRELEMMECEYVA